MIRVIPRVLFIYYRDSLKPDERLVDRNLERCGYENIKLLPFDFSFEKYTIEETRLFITLVFE